jgi:hypothetical protein
MEKVYDIDIDEVQLCITDFLRAITFIDIISDEIINFTEEIRRSGAKNLLATHEISQVLWKTKALGFFHNRPKVK